ncbi:hypothetical protein SAMN03159496_04043 [Rhizobium sp. NFR07]|nr:hypothetical protein SAMN03159496_04043 [Rhizobium sp. NFR07]
MMKEERPDASLFIGLHKLAEQNADGLVPELYEILANRGRNDDHSGNVVRFPAHATVGSTTIPQSEAGRILPFRR